MVLQHTTVCARFLVGMEGEPDCGNNVGYTGVIQGLRRNVWGYIGIVPSNGGKQMGRKVAHELETLLRTTTQDFMDTTLEFSDV